MSPSPRAASGAPVHNMLRRLISSFAAVSLLAAFPAAGAPSLDPANRTAPWVVGPPIAIEHVTVLPMTGDGRAQRDMTVVLREGRIVAISPAADARVPQDARRIDGRGKWLLPAFADMHIHLENDRALRRLSGSDDVPNGAVSNADVFLPYVANGVLQVFNLAGMPEALQQRNDVESGRVLGPHMALAAMADGNPPLLPSGLSHVTATPSDGRQFVRDMKAGGFDHIKTYSVLDAATFHAIVDEAHKQGMRVVGHIPGKRQDITETFLKPGFDLVAHAEEFAYQARDLEAATSNIPRYVGLAKANGTWLVSTLSLDERIDEQMDDLSTLKRRPELRFVHPITRAAWLNRNPYANSPAQRVAMVKAVVVFNRKLVKAFADAGIPVLPGTDSLVPGVVAGFSLHDEFVSLARAGLTSEQILTGATRQAAEWLGVLSDRGTVEVGKRADLVLLNADPLADIRATRQIAAVLSSGRYYSRQQLDRMMSGLADRYAHTPPSKMAGAPAASAPARAP